MSFKKFLCLLLVFVMIFAMASACGKTETDPDPDQDGSQTEVLPPEDEDDDGFVPTGNVNPLTGLCDGIADKALVMQEGYSTAPESVRAMGFGAGMGLPNVKRHSHNFSLESEVGKGTVITADYYL